MRPDAQAPPHGKGVAIVSLLREAGGSIAASSPDLWQVWGPILAVYILLAVSHLVVLPLFYLLQRFGTPLAYALRLDSPPPPIAPVEYPARLAELRQTALRRGRAIASVVDVIATLLALIFIIGLGSQYDVSLGAVVLYAATVVLAGAGGTALWIVPLCVTIYLADRANLQRRV